MKEQLRLRGQLKRFLQWPIILSVILIAMNFVVYGISIKAGIFVTIVLFVYVILALILFKYYRPAIFRELIGFAHEYDDVQKTMLTGLALPYALLDGDGKIVWMNEAFAQVIGKDLIFNKNINTVFTDFHPDEIPKGDEQVTVPVQYNQSYYDLTMHRIAIDQLLDNSQLMEQNEKYSYLVATYLFDVTELNEYKNKYEDEKLVVGMIYLDNYDEALESVEEVRRSLLVALIDRKINKYFATMDGLVKKLEKDKYFLVMRQRSLALLREQRFGILEDVKTVNIGNDMALTLSIGIGLNGANYAQNYEQSRIAIEMALGRGGDQAVVKDGDSISYYGGKSQQMEKATRVKARVKAQALKEFISAKDKVVVMGHRITDVDAFGAGIGIYRASKALGKTAHIVINDPTTSIKPLMLGFIESSDYENDMFVTSQEAKEMVDNNTAVVVVDTNKPSYTECPELLNMTKTIVVLDHHRRGNESIENAVLSYIEPYASSACEMIAEILQYFSDGIRIRNIEADSIYAGMMIDTNNFLTKTGVRTFEAAAFLRRCGADVTRVRKMLRDNMDAYKARAEAISKAEQFMDFYAITVCPGEGLESPTVVAAQTANELLNISGVKASFVLTNYNNVIYISARAIDEVNVQIIMEKLGGGGHMNIAGAQIENHTKEEAVQILKDVISQMQKEGEI